MLKQRAVWLAVLRCFREATVADGSNGVGSHSATADGSAASRPKKRRWDDALPQHTTPAPQPQPQPPAPAPAAPALSQIDLIKQQIAERARKLNIPVTINGPSTTSTAASSVASTPAVKSELRQWAPLRLDELGRQVDESGQVVTVKREAELRVNQQPLQPDSKKAKYARAKKEKSAAAAAEEEQRSATYFDASLPGGGKRGAGERQRREMRFVAAGTHEKEAALMRQEIVEREMEAAAKAETKEVDEETRRREEEERLAKEREEHIIVPTIYPAIPDIEWWDAAITTPQSTAAHVQSQCHRQPRLYHVVHLPSQASRGPSTTHSATTQADPSHSARAQEAETTREAGQGARAAAVAATGSHTAAAAEAAVVESDGRAGA